MVVLRSHATKSFGRSIRVLTILYYLTIMLFKPKLKRFAQVTPLKEAISLQELFQFQGILVELLFSEFQQETLSVMALKFVKNVFAIIHSHPKTSLRIIENAKVSVFHGPQLIL
jgi:hypothetical protein